MDSLSTEFIGRTSKQGTKGSMAFDNTTKSGGSNYDAMAPGIATTGRSVRRLRERKPKSSRQHSLDGISDSGSDDAVMHSANDHTWPENAVEDDVWVRDYLCIGHYIDQPHIKVYSMATKQGNLCCRIIKDQLSEEVQAHWDDINPTPGSASGIVKLAAVHLGPKVRGFFRAEPIDLDNDAQRRAAAKAFYKSALAKRELSPFKDVDRVNSVSHFKEPEDTSKVLDSLLKNARQMRDITDSYKNRIEVLNADIESQDSLITGLWTTIDTHLETINQQKKEIHQMQIKLSGAQNGPLEIFPLELDGSEFHKVFQRIPDGEVNCGMFLEIGGREFSSGSKYYHESVVLCEIPFSAKQAYDNLAGLVFEHDAEKLQGALLFDREPQQYVHLVVGGTSTGERVEIDGLIFDRYVEAGLDKLVQKLVSNSLYEYDGKLFVRWILRKEKREHWAI